jgi:hypothetical protein
MREHLNNLFALGGLVPAFPEKFDFGKFRHGWVHSTGVDFNLKDDDFDARYFASAPPEVLVSFDQ